MCIYIHIPVRLVQFFTGGIPQLFIMKSFAFPQVFVSLQGVMTLSGRRENMYYKVNINTIILVVGELLRGRCFLMVRKAPQGHDGGRAYQCYYVFFKCLNSSSSFSFKVGLWTNDILHRAKWSLVSDGMEEEHMFSMALSLQAVIPCPVSISSGPQSLNMLCNCLIIASWYVGYKTRLLSTT